MTDKIVLCRRNQANLGEPPAYCCRPIAKPNALNWCSSCSQRLPIWPQDAIIEPREVLALEG